MGIALDEQQANDIHEVLDGIAVILSPDDLEIVRRHGGVEIKYYSHSIWGGFDVRFKGTLGALVGCKTCGDDTCA